MVGSYDANDFPDIILGGSMSTPSPAAVDASRLQQKADSVGAVADQSTNAAAERNMHPAQAETPELPVESKGVYTGCWGFNVISVACIDAKCGPGQEFYRDPDGCCEACRDTGKWRVEDLVPGRPIQSGAYVQ